MMNGRNSQTGFKFIMVAAVAQMAFVASLWAGAAYVVYKLLQYFGVL